jgi:ribosomal protein S18 acetylase RimI-like enzyme
MKQLMDSGTFVKETEGNELRGCVYLQKQGDKLYLGMLSVSPGIQTQGIGKKLLEAAEKQALEQNCRAIIMNVISLRHELIHWYERHGYKLTGRKKPFPADDKFGKPVIPLEFVELEKFLV